MKNKPKRQPKPVGILIAIKPPRVINENISKLRAYITKAEGKNIYGNSDPHITLFVNTFYNFSDVENLLEKIVAKHRPFQTNIECLHDFNYDPINKTHTYVYRLNPSPELKKIHKDITGKLNEIRTDHQEKSMLKKKMYSNKEEESNIQKYGFPFGPDKWIYHASIGSVSNKNHDKTWKYAQKFNIKKKWIVNSINAYVHLGTDGFVLFKEYRLN